MFGWVSEASAKASGVSIVARCLGGGTSGGAHADTAPRPDRRGAALRMRDAGISLADIDYVNVHGTDTPVGLRAAALAFAGCDATGTVLALVADNLARVDTARMAVLLSVPPTRISFHCALDEVCDHVRFGRRCRSDNGSKLPAKRGPAANRRIGESSLCVRGIIPAARSSPATANGG